MDTGSGSQSGIEPRGNSRKSVLSVQLDCSVEAFPV